MSVIGLLVRGTQSSFLACRRILQSLDKDALPVAGEYYVVRPWPWQSDRMHHVGLTSVTVMRKKPNLPVPVKLPNIVNTSYITTPTHLHQQPDNSHQCNQHLPPQLREQELAKVLDGIKKKRPKRRTIVSWATGKPLFFSLSHYILFY